MLTFAFPAASSRSTSSSRSLSSVRTQTTRIAYEHGLV
jgi:hypothetical protein